MSVELITNETGLAILWLVFGFAAVATLNAGYFVMVTSYTAGMTMTWAVQGQDITVLNSTERINAELAALGIALFAVAFLQWWATTDKLMTTLKRRSLADAPEHSGAYPLVISRT